MKNDKKHIKYVEKKRRLESMIDEIKYPLAVSTKKVLFSELISPYDIQLPLLNDFLKEYDEETDPYVMNKALSYTVRQIKMRNWKDNNGFDVEDKFYYFKKTLLNNIQTVKDNEGIA